MSESRAAVKVEQDKSPNSWECRMWGPFEERGREFDSRLRRGWRHPLRSNIGLRNDESSLTGKMPSVDAIDKDDDVLVKVKMPGVDK